MNYLLIYITDDCPVCSRVVENVITMLIKFPKINLKIKNIKFLKKSPRIVPAVYINEKLYSYGEFNEGRLVKVLEKISFEIYD